jgi:membrane-associated protein
MPYPRFVAFSLFGSLLWIGSLLTLGYLFGNVPVVRDSLGLMIVGVFVLFLLIILIGHRRQRRA